MWDPVEGVGVDLVVDLDADGMDVEAVRKVKSSPVNETEKTRLRSLLLGGVETLEEWLDAEGEGATSVLEGMGLKEQFNEVFSRSMDELGGFEGLRLERLSVTDKCTPQTDMMEV